MDANANGPTAHLDHSDRGPLFLSMSWLLSSLATVFLCLRIYCKIWTRRSLWWDDWILIGAWVTLMTNDILTTILIEEYKLGRHGYDLAQGDPVRFMLLLSSRATATITALTWTKTAFAVALLRLTKGYTLKFVWFIIISLNITMGFSAAVPWIQCNPVKKCWDFSVEGTCWPAGTGVNLWIGTGAYSAACDFILAVIPWTFLWQLRLRRKEKIGIAIAMSMGIIAGAVAIVKCIKLPNLNSPDAYNAAELYMWDLAESTATMMAACIPSLRVLFRDVREHSSHFRTSKLPVMIPYPVMQNEKNLSDSQRDMMMPSDRVTTRSPV